jgi:hypothetical protein
MEEGKSADFPNGCSSGTSLIPDENFWLLASVKYPGLKKINALYIPL